MASRALRHQLPQFFVPVVVDPAMGPLPNPNPTVIKEWGQLPDGRTWGSTAGVDIGPDGHVWAYDRCGAVASDRGLRHVRT